MANATLQSFNAFLTERLTAAAVDIYGFVEKTVIDYQDEVYRTKLENQRLQRLLDLVYRPEIRLHRADSRQIDLPTQEVCAQEQQIEKECIPTEVKEEPVILPFKEELIDPWARTGETPAPLACSSVSDARIVTVGEHEENEMADNLTQVVTVGEHSGYEAPDSLTQVVTVGEHSRYEAPDSLTQVVTVGNHDNYDTQSQDDQPLLTFGVSPLYTREKNMFFCNLCHQSFLNKAELKLHLESHATKSSPNSTNKVFTCFVCGKVTNTKSHMMSHMRSHTGEKPYSCSICGNQYKLKGHMKEHLRTHTGERPFTCFICGMSFNRSSTMSKHARIRHREYVPFKCTECSQRFPVLAMLKQHMKTVHDITFSV